MSGTYSREGVKAAVRLVSQTEAVYQNESIKDTCLLVHIRNIWKTIESRYNDMINQKGGAKLSSLDKFCGALRDRLHEQMEKKKFGKAMPISLHITKEELLKIVEWKFAKGKPRYALMKHLNANSTSSIISASKLAFEVAYPDGKSAVNQNLRNEKRKEALQHLCSLKGVGPATASAVLCLLHPNQFCFMDDEVIECLYDKKRGYTMPIYLDVNSKCEKISLLLNSSNDESNFWTPYQVGRTLWTAARLSANGCVDDISLLSISSLQGSGEATSKETIHVEKNDNGGRKRKKKGVINIEDLFSTTSETNSSTIAKRTRSSHIAGAI